MNSFITNRLKEKVIFENKEINHNIFKNTKLNDSNELSKKIQTNKSDDIKWENYNQLELKVSKGKEADDLNDNIREYFESKKSTQRYQSVNDSVNKENGLHNLLQIYMLSDESNEKADVVDTEECPMIKSRYGKDSMKFNLNNNTALNFYKKERNKEMKCRQKIIRRTNSTIQLLNDKLAQSEILSGNNCLEKSGQGINNANYPHYHIIHLNNKHEFKERSIRRDSKVNINKYNTKEDFCYLNQQLANRRAVSFAKNGKYSTIPLINEMLLKMFQKSFEEKQPLFSGSYPNIKFSNSNFVSDFYKPDNSEFTHKTNNFIKINPYRKAKRNKFSRIIEIDKRKSRIIHQREIYLNEDGNHKSLSTNQHTNSTKNCLLPKGLKTLYLGSLSHAKKPPKGLIESYKGFKKKQAVYDLKLGQTTEAQLNQKFLVSNVNTKNKGPRLAPRLFQFSEIM